MNNREVHRFRISGVISPLLLLLLSAASLAAQQEYKPGDVLAPDPQITIGTFDNGLRYYIRANKKPEERLELRLVVKAGSVLEDDDQQGLAHFVEHMAFNGTKNFPKMDLVNFLERTGVRFGPHLNAYTSFDETVYMLRVPTDSAHIVEKAFQILEDWAHNLSFDESEVDKERGVVGEEWRLGRGAFERIQNKHNPVIFHASKYAERLPIGKKEIIDNAPSDALKRFYHDWYRPDLMAVVAVGDYDTAALKGLIAKHFGGLQNPANERERTAYTLPGHDRALISVATDKEMPVSRVQVLFKRAEDEQKTVKDYRTYILNSLYDGMLNARMSERLQKPNPPFVFGGAGNFTFVGGVQAYSLFVNAKEDGILSGTEAILTEAYRVAQHGFTGTELVRQKANALRGIEQSYNEREKTESARHAAEYIRHFLQDELIPGIAVEYDLYKQLLPKIDLQEVNALTAVRMTDKNRVITVSAPEKEGVIVPSEQEMLGLFGKVSATALEPYIDAASEAPLLASKPKPGSITKVSPLEGLGAEEWTLSNGARVVVKSTDFKNDEVLFSAWSPGGHSLVTNDDYMSAANISQVIGSSGIGEFDAVTLQKMMAGKVVRVSPSVSERSENLNGQASPKDLETLFQMTYLYFVQPRLDEPAVGAYMNRVKAFLQNFKVSPEATFQDTVSVTLANYHFRARPMTPELLDEVNPERSFTIFKDRFADASDFVFFVVGAVEVAELRPLVETYLAGLPDKDRNEAWKDVGIHHPEGRIEKVVRKGVEPKSAVQLSMNGPFTWNEKERFDFNALIEVLRIKLREVLREDKGGVYGVGVRGSASKYPRAEYAIRINFGCAPERVDELIDAVNLQMDSLAMASVDEDYVDKVKELLRRDRETNEKQNSWWLGLFRGAYENGEDPSAALAFGKQVEALSTADIRTAAQKYFAREDYVRVVMMPETGENEGQ